MPTRTELEEAKRKLLEQKAKINAALKGQPPDPDIVTTQMAVAKHFNVQRSTVTRWVAAGMPGEVGRWSIKAITEWRETQKEDEELLASTSDSPWLEELRKNKALQEQIKLEAMRRTVVQIDKMQDALGVWSAILKRLGERVGRKYGRDAGDMVLDAIDDCDRVLGTVFAAHHGNGNGDDRQTDGGAVAAGGSPRGTPAADAPKRKTRAPKANKRVGRKRADPAKRPVQRRKVQAPSAPGKQVVVRGFGFGFVE